MRLAAVRSAAASTLAAAPRCAVPRSVHPRTFATTTPRARDSTPSEQYERLVEAGTLREDDFQRGIVGQLDALHHQLRTYEQPAVPQGAQSPRRSLFGSLFGWGRGQEEPTATRPSGTPPSLYLYGTVGTGKSMLMDLFYHTLPERITRKRRVHFHQFMIDVHKRSHFFKVQEPLSDALEKVIREIAQQAEVLCFDEFQVTDIADAMILRQVLGRLLEYGVVLVVTSNRPPADLYINGIQRESFIPCIRLIESQYTVMDLNSGMDYRRVPRKTHQVYFLSSEPSSARAFDEQWQAATGGEPVQQNRKLEVWGRELLVPQSTSTAARFTFHELCGDARSAADYIALCSSYPTIFVGEIPQLSLSMRDAARRFITFIDAAYESKTHLFCSSAVDIMQVFSSGERDSGPPSSQMRALMDDLNLSMENIGHSPIFKGDEELFAFSRVLSRLSEMRSEHYVQLVSRNA